MLLGMRRVVCALTCGCNLITPVDDLRKGADASSDAGSALRCDKAKPFATPELVSEIHATNANELAARLTQDELGIFFTRVDPDAGFRIEFASRSDTASAFGAAAIVTSVVGPDIDAYPTVSGDELGLYFHSDRDGGNFDLFQASRPTRSAMFGAPAVLATLATSQYDAQPYISPDGSFLLFVRGPGSGGPLDIYESAWTGTQFAAPFSLGVSSPANEASPVITTDGLTLYFASDRGGNVDVWRATRTDKMSPAFSPPVMVSELATNDPDTPTWISPDECVIYLHRPSGGGNRILRATRPR